MFLVLQLLNVLPFWFIAVKTLEGASEFISLHYAYCLYGYLSYL